MAVRDRLIIEFGQVDGKHLVAQDFPVGSEPSPFLEISDPAFAVAYARLLAAARLGEGGPCWPAYSE